MLNEQLIKVMHKSRVESLRNEARLNHMLKDAANPRRAGRRNNKNGTRETANRILIRLKELVARGQSQRAS